MLLLLLSEFAETKLQLCQEKKMRAKREKGLYLPWASRYQIENPLSLFTLGLHISD